MKFVSYEEARSHWKRYAWSTLVTFLAGALLVVTPELDSLTMDSFRDGAVAGLLFAAVRAGTKAVFELALANFKKIS